jgi:hypothetical protein
MKLLLNYEQQNLVLKSKSLIKFKIIKAGTFSPAAETCTGLTGNFLPELATLTSMAKDLVWLTFCYFIAS